jgi:hypothetical protein
MLAEKWQLHYFSPADHLRKEVEKVRSNSGILSRRYAGADKTPVRRVLWGFGFWLTVGAF